ncbi:MAG: tetratricopeptide repeat protein [Ardenticatenaceae bacterium]
MLRRRKNDRALKLATDALKLATTSQEKATAQQIMAEVHFRMAMVGEIDQQLPQLERALVLTPDDSRIRFYRGITLWRQNNLPEALKDLELVATQDPNRPGVNYLLQLARLSLGKSWTIKNLTPAEVNRLNTIQQVLSGKSVVSSNAPELSTEPEVWQILLDMHADDTAPVESFKEAAAETKNPSIKGLLHYYEGVAAMRNGEPETTRTAWRKAQATGFSTSWMEDNFKYSLREKATELAKQEQWSAIVNLSNQNPDEVQDRILSETIALAYFHLGYNEAEAEKWSRAVNYWRQAEKWGSNRYIAQNLALAEEALGNWTRAADAWRDMIRRRPRSTKHPDYLTDSQISGIWRHMAQCYREVRDLSEVISCLKNGLKYGENDVELRMELVNVYFYNDYEHAAQTQLERILEIDPNYLDALVRLGHMYLEQRGKDPTDLWKRALVIEPSHVDARNGLALSYIQKLDNRPMSETDQIVEEVLNDLPDHPRLLLGIGLRYYHLKQDHRSRRYLFSAYDNGPQEVKIADEVIHHLLLVGGQAEVESIVPRVQQIEGLLPPFWFDLARRALQKDQGIKWVKRFLEEAITLADRPYVQDSKATLLMKAYELIERVAPAFLCRYFVDRIRREVPSSGAVEFVKAFDAVGEEDDRNAKRWFSKAKRLARRARDKSALEFIEHMEQINLFAPEFDISPELIMRLMELFPDGPPSIEELFEVDF